jgi:hypothetical protein
LKNQKRELPTYLLFLQFRFQRLRIISFQHHCRHHFKIDHDSQKYPMQATTFLVHFLMPSVISAFCVGEHLQHITEALFDAI